MAELPPELQFEERGEEPQASACGAPRPAAAADALPALEVPRIWQVRAPVISL